MAIAADNTAGHRLPTTFASIKNFQIRSKQPAALLMLAQQKANRMLHRLVARLAQETIHYRSALEDLSGKYPNDTTRFVMENYPMNAWYPCLS